MSFQVSIAVGLCGLMGLLLPGCSLYQAAQKPKPVPSNVARPVKIPQTPPTLSETPPVRQVLSETPPVRQVVSSAVASPIRATPPVGPVVGSAVASPIRETPPVGSVVGSAVASPLRRATPPVEAVVGSAVASPLRATPSAGSVVNSAAAPSAPNPSSGSAVMTAPVAVLPVEPAKSLFAPYMSTNTEKTPPSNWVTTPNYDFPWIAGALPDRVTEEATYGVGADMFGRLYAKVSFGSEALIKPVEPPSQVVRESAQRQRSKSTSVISSLFGSEKNNKLQLETPRTLQKSTHAGSIQCVGVACLDEARNMLIADAQSKGWKMLLNRRVSLHQSFQFDRSSRVIWIELNSDGKNEVKIEYALLPNQR